MKNNIELIARALLISFILFVTGEMILRTGGFFLLVPILILLFVSFRSRGPSSGNMPWEDPSDWWKKGKRE